MFARSALVVVVVAGGCTLYRVDDDTETPDAAKGADAAHDAPAGIQPVAHYRMDAIGSDGFCALDDSEKYDGVCVGRPPTLTSGVANMAFHFATDEENPTGEGFQVVPSAGDLASPSELTVSIWARPTLGTGGCFANRTDGSGTDDIWQFCLDYADVSYPGSELELYVANGSGAYLATDWGSGSGWHHIALTWADTTSDVYIDGVLVSSQPGELAGSSADTLSFGRDIDNGTGSDAYSGDLDELRLYDHALSTAQIQALYTGADF